MNLIKKQVNHKIYGQGRVVNLSDSFVEIQFSIGNKKFVYPDAFGTYLMLLDSNAANKVKHIKEKQQIEHKLREIKEEKKRAARLEEQQLRMRNEKLIKNLKIHPSSQAVFWCPKEEHEKIFTEWSIFIGSVKSGKRQGKISRAARLDQNSACFITSREPDEPEQERRILGAYMVDTGFTGRLCEDGIIRAHPDYRIKLMEEDAEKMLFWNYCVSEKNPLKMTWNTGRYRYFDNVIMAQVLKDMVSMKKKTVEHGCAQRFFEHFCRINQIDKNTLAKPDGALLRNDFEDVV